jgi:hypothetical protein
MIRIKVLRSGNVHLGTYSGLGRAHTMCDHYFEPIGSNREALLGNVGKIKCKSCRKRLRELLEDDSDFQRMSKMNKKSKRLKLKIDVSRSRPDLLSVRDEHGSATGLRKKLKENGWKPGDFAWLTLITSSQSDDELKND